MQKYIPRQCATQPQSIGVRHVSSRSHAMEQMLFPQTDSGVFHLHTFYQPTAIAFLVGNTLVVMAT